MFYRVKCGYQSIHIAIYLRQRGAETNEMKAVKTRDIKNRTKEILDEAAGGETIVVSRPRNQNVVVLSEAYYNKIIQAAEIGQPIMDKRQRKHQRQSEQIVFEA